MSGECVDKTASRKYKLRMLAVSLVYIGFVFLSVHGLRKQPAAPWKYVIAVLPMLPILLIPLFFVQLLRSLDELQRRIQLEALGFAFAASALVTLTYGFLENAGLPDVNWVWVWPIMAVFWTLGLFAARWRYR